MKAHPFDEAVELQARGSAWVGRTHPGYANFIGPYGGITAAQLVSAVLGHPHRLGDPVAFTVNFASAIAEGEFEIEAHPARTNRSTQHWSIAMRQEGEIVATATAVTALRRDTWGVVEAKPPGVPRPETVARASGSGRVQWPHRYDMRPLAGSIPERWEGQDTGSSLSRLWMRDDPPRPLDFASLTGMADIFFPRMWLRRTTFVPVGTVSMTVYYHARAADLAATGTGYLLGQVQGQGFGGGYFDHNAQIWNEAGTLLATTQQVVYYKE